MRIGESIKTATVYVTRALPLHKWKRDGGPASFLAALLALRKTIVLCSVCEKQMGRKWADKINYGIVKSFHADDTHCDKCRNETTCNMYIPVEGSYYQEMTFAEKCVRQTKERERQQMLR